MPALARQQSRLQNSSLGNLSWPDQAISPFASTHNPLLVKQEALGNYVMQRLLRSRAIRTKLTINQPGINTSRRQTEWQTISDPGPAKEVAVFSQAQGVRTSGDARSAGRDALAAGERRESKSSHPETPGYIAKVSSGLGDPTVSAVDNAIAAICMGAQTETVSTPCADAFQIPQGITQALQAGVGTYSVFTAGLGVEGSMADLHDAWIQAFDETDPEVLPKVAGVAERAPWGPLHSALVAWTKGVVAGKLQAS
jgi:hypothetical protein